jgi:hypothetical protein
MFAVLRITEVDPFDVRWQLSMIESVWTLSYVRGVTWDGSGLCLGFDSAHEMSNLLLRMIPGLRIPE